jgi:hypothetical protein
MCIGQNISFHPNVAFYEPPDIRQYCWWIKYGTAKIRHPPGQTEKYTGTNTCQFSFVLQFQLFHSLDPSKNSTLESLTVHDFFDNNTSLASSPCKVYCSFVQFGDTGLPCPVHLVPSDGTTPERVVIEKVVSCRSVLLRWNPYRLWMEKGFKLVIV